jgi:P-type Mg2+ transporter
MLSVPQCLERFQSSLSGLHEIQIEGILAQHGLNVLSAAKPRRWWNILLACLPNPFNILLTILAIISIATDQTATFVILMVMVVFSVGLRFWQERRNNVAMNELIKLVDDHVVVVRNGIELQIPRPQIIPGDIVRLSGGDVVPADVVLASTSGLYVSQSSLTGENLPVLKQFSDYPADPQSILESSNICFAGSTVTSGSAAVLVVATGDSMFRRLGKVDHRYIYWLIIEESD